REGAGRRTAGDGGEVLAQAAQADDLVRPRDVFLLPVQQVGAAGQQLGGAPGLIEQADGLRRRRGPVVGEVFHDCFPPFAARAASTRSGLKGECGTRTPMAFMMALPMAALVEIVGGSPMPMTPRSGMSCMWTMIFGMSFRPPSL